MWLETEPHLLVLMQQELQWVAVGHPSALLQL
jgi:hypothetical protein